MPKNEKKKTAAEILHHHRVYGSEVLLPHTQRMIRVKSPNIEELLRHPDKVPNILMPLVVKSVYSDLRDRELKEFTEQARNTPEDALAFIDALKYVAKLTIADNTKVEDLSLSELRWLFRMVMGPAELLAPFRPDEEGDVEDLGQGNEVPQAAE